MAHSPPSKTTMERITSLYHWTDKHLSFRCTRPTGYQFTPGQFARLGLINANGVTVSRAYSITSAIEENELEFFLVIVPGGEFSGLLINLKIGDSILLERFSYGFLTIDRFIDGEDLWMLATGTGLGPFISILQDPPTWKKFRHLVLVRCVRHIEELAYQDLLNNLSQLPILKAGGAQLRLISSNTSDISDTKNISHDHLHGRITTLLSNGELERAAGLTISVEKSRMMLCGNPEMISATREILHARGMRPCRRATPGQFVTEDYW